MDDVFPDFKETGASGQGLMQAVSLAVTLGMALLGGLIVGTYWKELASDARNIFTGLRLACNITLPWLLIILNVFQGSSLSSLFTEPH